MEFHPLATVMAGPERPAIELPVRITGTMSEPKLRPEIEILAKGRLGKKLRETLSDKLQVLLDVP
jgi:hypothetical protein